MKDNKEGTLSDTEHKITAEELRNTFMVHILAGVTLCFAITFLKLSIYLAVLFGIGIMASYYYQFHKGQKPAALLSMFSDSVYYLGFILTLASLVCSMLFFNIESGASSASIVISQFGAAMITTLVGLGLRIYLQNFDTTVESAQLSARESLDETVRGFNVQMRLTNESLSKLSSVMNKSIEDTEERNKKSLEMLKDTQERLVKLGEDSLSGFSSAAKDVIADSLSELEQLSATISQRVSKVGSEIVKSNEKLFEDLREKVELALSSQMNNVTEQIETSLKEAVTASDKFSAELEETNKNIKSLGTTTAHVTKNIADMEFFVPDIKAMSESQDKYISNLDLLSSEVESKTRSLMKVERDMQSHMSAVAQGYEKVINSYQEVISSSKASQLVEEESKLLEALKSRAESIDVLAKQWDIDVRAMAEHSRDFSENLVKTAKFITTEMQTPATTKEVVNG